MRAVPEGGIIIFQRINLKLPFYSSTKSIMEHMEGPPMIKMMAMGVIVKVAVENQLYSSLEHAERPTQDHDAQKRDQLTAKDYRSKQTSTRRSRSLSHEDRWNSIVQQNSQDKLDELNINRQTNDVTSSFDDEEDVYYNNRRRTRTNADQAPPMTWYCLCYKEKIRGVPQKSTACRRSYSDCDKLERKIERGTRILVKGSQTSCMPIVGSHPSDGSNQDRTLWQESKRAASWWSPNGCLIH